MKKNTLVRICHGLLDSVNPAGLAAVHGRHESDGSTLQQLTRNVDVLEQRWSHLWLTGPFPRGLVRAKGKGSPFCVRDHRAIDPRFGTLEDMRVLAARMPVILDAVFNHTAWDHEWLARRDWYVQCKGGCQHEHCCWQQTHCAGFRDTRRGGRNHWEDVAQLNLAEKAVWDEHLRTIDFWVQQGVAGFRVDSADSLLRESFEQTWGVPTENHFGNFMAEVRRRYPNLLMVAESHSGTSRLAELGFDVVYHSAEREGEMHWRDALATRNSFAIQRAIRSVAEQVNSGRLVLVDCGNHDQPAPLRRYGQEWLPGALALTWLAPCNLHLLGNEVGYDAWPNDPSVRAREMETRPQPMSIDCNVDWSRGLTDPYQQLFQQQEQIRQALEHVKPDDAVSMRADLTDGAQGWVGYQTKRGDVTWTVMANPTDSTVKPFDSEQLVLEPGGYRCLIQDRHTNVLEREILVRTGGRVSSLSAWKEPRRNTVHIRGETKTYHAVQLATCAALDKAEQGVEIANAIQVV